MIDFLISSVKNLLLLLHFILLALLNCKANLKKKERYKQFLMPILAFVLVIILTCWQFNKKYRHKPPL